MNRTRRRTAFVALAIPFVLALAWSDGRSAELRAAIQLFSPPAGPGSGMYSLFAAQGRAYLSWLEPAGGRTQVLRFSTTEGRGWSAPLEVARGENWFVNWADHPSLVALPDGTLAAHWLVNNGTSKQAYGYGFRIAISRDRGRSWREVYAGGTRNTNEDYSGFVSLLPTTDGFTAVYLGPPREPAAARHDGHAGHTDHAEHTMTLGSIRFGRDGAVLGEAVADANTCSCCSTSIVQAGGAALAAYRDRTAGEIRDIAVVALRDGRWQPPRPVHDDRWNINACPTNGPVLDARGSRVAVAWFTGAGDVPRVKLAFSTDGGQSFTAPVVVDGGRPVGWPSTVLLDDGSAVVSWLESLGTGRGELRLRRVSPDGRLADPLVVADAAPGRSTGIPHMVRLGGELLLAWRDGRVQTARIPLEAVPTAAGRSSR